MYPWHNPPSNTAGPGPPRAAAAGPGPGTGLSRTTPSPSYRVPVSQLRWLPSMITQPHPQQGHTTRHQHPNPNTHPQPHPSPPQPAFSPGLNGGGGISRNTEQSLGVVENRLEPTTVTLSDGEGDGDGDGDGDRSSGSSSPGNGRDTGGRGGGGGGGYVYANGSGSHTQTPMQQQRQPLSNSHSHSHSHSNQIRNHPNLQQPSMPTSEEHEPDYNPRRHGKRLTTKEEVTLFEICNRHAPEFGQRSNLCNWWKKVTDEFTRTQGHPYSWHSVRRKVEIVTKQRMKFLEDSTTGDHGGGGGEDLSNPQWRDTVDAWIPTWQKWEEAEAKRIEKRDSRKGRRKRKNRSWESTGGIDGVSISDGENTVVPSGGGAMPPPPAPSQQQQQPRLPPGFDSMFQPPHTPQSRNGNGNGNGMYPGYPTNSPTNTPGMDNNMMNAMLETLNKLNKRLDTTTTPTPTPTSASASTPPHQSNPNPRASPVISNLVTNTDSPQTQTQTQNQQGTLPLGMTDPAENLRKLKEELRREMQLEMRRELERDRAGLEEKLDSVQRTQDMIIEMLRQEPGQGQASSIS